MSIKAKTCPFCGISLENIPPSKVFYHVNNGCILSSENFSINDIEKWNTRKPMQDIVERLEELFKHHNATKTVKRLVLEVVKNVGGMKLGVLLKPKQHELKILEMFLHKQCDLERTKFAYSQEEVWNAVKKATEALEKQIPKKVVYHDDSGNKTVSERCPICFEIAHSDYCEYCGQALEWTGEGE